MIKLIDTIKHHGRYLYNNFSNNNGIQLGRLYNFVDITYQLFLFLGHKKIINKISIYTDIYLLWIINK